MTGPLEVMAIAFPSNRFKGEIMLALTSAVEHGAIRIIDVTFILKDPAGWVTSYELAELTEPEATPFDLVDETMGIISVSDIDQVAARLANDSSAAVIAFEHAWASRLECAVLAAGGQVVTHERIPPGVAQAAREASAASEMARGGAGQARSGER